MLEPCTFYFVHFPSNFGITGKCHSSLKILLSPKHPLLFGLENSSRLSSPGARLLYVLMSAGGLICEICMLGNWRIFQKMKNEESWTFSRQTEISSIWPLTLVKAGKYTRSWNKKSAIVPRTVEPAHVARCTSAIGRVGGREQNSRQMSHFQGA